MRIRTIRECAQIIKAEDPNTQLTEYVIRKMVVNGEIPYKTSGSKYLINIDQLYSVFGKDIQPPEEVSLKPDETQLLSMYNDLNEKGKQEVLRLINIVSYYPGYND